MTMSDVVIQSAETVFGIMGSGHSEAVYEASLDVELMLRKIARRRQVPCILKYKLEVVGTGFIDILVENHLIVEIKSIAKLTNKDEQQVRKYLKATGLYEGLLINFGNDLEIIRVQKNEPREKTHAELFVEFLDGPKLIEENHDETLSAES